jgi:phage antirepressor YoqD-like protein
MKLKIKTSQVHDKLKFTDTGLFEFLTNKKYVIYLTQDIFNTLYYYHK